MRRDALIALALFAFALAVRLVYLQEIRAIPFFDTPVVDSRSYDEWAWRIASGDWWGDRVFYQAPAYPYFLAVVYRLFGHSLLAAHAAQMLAGALSCALLYLATRRFFGRGAGIAAGALLAVYAPALFFDGILQKTSLGLLLTSGLLLALARFVRAPGLLPVAVAGGLLGLLALTRENALVFAFVVPAWLLLAYRDEPLVRRGLWGAGFALGVLLVLLPVGARNQAVGGTFALTTSQLGPNFYIGNNPHATGLYAPLLPGRQTPDFEGRDARRIAEWELRRELGPGEVSRFWLGRGLAWIADAPGDAALLFARKALLTVSDFELADTQDIYVYGEFSRVLAGLLPVMRFGVLLPLAVAGMVIAMRDERRRREASLLLALAGVFGLTVAAFYVWGRYRFPVVPLLLPFAGLAVATAVEGLRARSAAGLAGPLVAALLAAGVSNLPLLDEKPFQVAAWANLGGILLQQERYDEAEPFLLRAAEISEESADLQLHLAALRSGQDRIEEAEAHLRRMLALAPEDFRGHRMLAQILRRQGRQDEARHHLREAVRLSPNVERRGRPGAAPAGR